MRRLFVRYFPVILTGLIISVVFVSCSQSPGDVLTEFKDSKNNKTNNPDKYYTTGTVLALKELENLTSKEKGVHSGYSDKKFAKGVEWDIVNEKINGDNADVTVKYIKHPVENMKGLEVTFRLAKENGEWKVDMEKELQRSLYILKMNERMAKKGNRGDQTFTDKMKEYIKSKK